MGSSSSATETGGSRPPLRIGLVGCGFMGRAHSNAFRQAPRYFDLPFEPVLQVACARSAADAARFAANWGYAAAETDWRALVSRPDVDLVDIATPNDTHAEIAVAAARAGKIVACEKPLGRDAAESGRIAEAVERAGVASMVWYNYRRVPALALAKRTIDEGRLGRIFHVRARFLQDWTISPDVPQGGRALWRLDAGAAGSGVAGDLLSHCIDAATWLAGPIAEVSAMSATFVPVRVHVATGRPQPVTIDDATSFVARFVSGALGTFEATRYARGHKADFSLEVNGEHASVAWDLGALNRLSYFDHRDEGPLRGLRSIDVSDGGHPYMDRWWVPGLHIGYEHTFVHQFADFLRSLADGTPPVPTFRDAWRIDRVTDAVLRSARENVRVEVAAAPITAG